MPDNHLTETIDGAITEALGDAYDCTRTWSAWSFGTMGPEDFTLVREQADRVAEIRDAILAAAAAEVSQRDRRIAELEAYAATRADEMLAATKRIRELERRMSELLSRVDERCGGKAAGDSALVEACDAARLALPSLCCGGGK